MRTPFPIVMMLILVIMMPIEISGTFGGLFLTPAKVFLLLMAFVMLPRLFQLKLQRFDWLIIAHGLWSTTSIFLIFGGGAVQSAGLYLLEFLVIYLMMRVYMTHLGQFRGLVGLLFLLVAVSTAAAVPEALSGQRYIHDFARSFTGFRYTYTNEFRLGILRSASFFEHQILFGIFCSSSLGILWFTSSVAQRMIKVPVIFLGTFLAASSAPLLAFVLQAMLIGVERVSRKMKNRVGRITFIAIVLGSLLQFGTNRGVVGTLALFTLNPLTAYYRREQWNFAMDDVKAHWVFGFDPTTWTRPGWMGASVDNNWLLMMMRSGVPSVIFLFVGILLIWRALAARGTEVPELFSQLRKGWGVMILAILFTGATVAFFGKLQPLLSFYIGLGAALAACPLPGAAPQAAAKDAGAAVPAAPDAPAAPARPGYTRFPGGLHPERNPVTRTEALSLAARPLPARPEEPGYRRPVTTRAAGYSSGPAVPPGKPEGGRG